MLIHVRRSIRLPDGRRLAYDDVGDPDGLPVLYLHPFAASRLQRHPDDGLAAACGVRLVAPDRPGIGGSDRLRWRRPVDWAADVRALADALRLDRFAVLGWSAGGPHALACAHALPERVTACGLASPAAGWFVGPGATPDADLSGRRLADVATSAGSWAWLLVGGLRRQVERDAERVVARQAAAHPDWDRAVLNRPEVRRMMAAALVEQFRQGTGGTLDEALAIARPWGFDPSAVRVPVLLWHGEADTVVTPGAARRLAARLPGCRATFDPEAGHYLVLDRWAEILSELARAAVGAGAAGGAP
jgi:pimeloyl-ACP methyl ester carboxylesterase